MSNVISFDPIQRAFEKWVQAKRENDPEADWYFANFISLQLPPHQRDISMELLMTTRIE